MEDTNIEFVLRGLDGGDRKLFITKESALAISAGGEIIVDGGVYEIEEIFTYLNLTSSNCYLSAGLPVMKIRLKRESHRLD